LIIPKELAIIFVVFIKSTWMKLHTANQERKIQKKVGGSKYVKPVDKKRAKKIKPTSCIRREQVSTFGSYVRGK